MKRDVLASTNLLGEHQPQDMKRAVSYLICSFALLLRNPLGDLPQPFQREQGRFHSIGIDEGSACVIRQASSDGSVIPIRQADNEIGIASSTDTNELYMLTMQGMMRMGHCHPFHRWLVKGGSVL